ncbi:MAG TPA: YciI family protein [Solirubrobacterales bacterium]
MRFMVNLVTDGSSMEGMTPEERAEFAQRMGEFMGEIENAGVLLHTDALGPVSDAKTLRRGRNGKVVVTDGPFAETKEQIAGYMVLDCKDIDEAVGWIERMPVAGGAVEVRPLAGRSEKP